MNGSSAVGRCSAVSVSDTMTTCTTPTTNVLFDSNIPELAVLDDDMWASQLLTLNIQNPAQITFNFTATPGYSGVRQVAVVMFNCPELGIAVQNIRLLIPPLSSRGTISTSDPTSCESPVRVCIPTDISENVLALQFIPVTGASWIHLAEVTFYDSDSGTERERGERERGERGREERERGERERERERESSVFLLKAPPHPRLSMSSNAGTSGPYVSMLGAMYT